MFCQSRPRENSDSAAGSGVSGASTASAAR
jgi:hypothetical protein